MDFLRDVKAKLEELEQMAREMEQQQKPGSSPKAKSFQPKQQPGRGAGPKSQKAGQNKGSQPKGGRQQPQAQQQRGQQRGQQQAQANTRSVRQPVDAAECPVEEWMDRHPATRGRVPEGSFILDNLQEYVGEAFLIQEILGPPMCMRELD